MENFTKVTIYDTEGNCIFDDKLISPFVGLQTGETFWFGNDNSKRWGKVIKISYGIDTDLKCYVIEMVIENSNKRETKTANPEYNLIDHGEKKITGDGGTWNINKGDIIVTVGTPGHNDLERMTLQANFHTGPMIVSKKDLELGDFIELTGTNRKVICTLINSMGSPYGTPYSIVRVTESKLI